MKNQQPKHTPGPWAVKEYTHAINGEQYYSVTTEALGVGDVIPNGITNNKANAHLIAAAPEMLEALEHMRDGYMWHVSEGRFVSELEPKIEYLSSIIRKAKGE